MCGICGQVNSEHDRPVDRSVLDRMNAVITHRGPDSDGFYVNGRVGMAMRRLAIIDLAGGQQPISNEAGNTWVVFNGEIYNFHELRLNLESKGHEFRTNSDTETIVHLYEEYGADCVNHLRGMFAFAVWDETHQRLFAARDRLGQKPLYFAEHNGTFLFGSELKCILQYPGFPRDVDLQGLHHYLTLQYVPAPLTAFKHARKLMPGHYLVWEQGNVRIDRYWDLAYEPKYDCPPAELRERVRAAVSEAVRLRLISDVSLGVHLSGGIDSSIIVALMAGMMNEPVKTFSIGFKADAFNELSWARQIACRYSTDHHEFMLEPDALDILPKLTDHFDEPFADPAAIPTWYLAQMTRQHVTVALNGDGGDEAFAGYQRYYIDPIADMYAFMPGWLRHGVCDRLFDLLPVRTDRPLERDHIMALRRLSRAADMPRSSSIVRWGSYFSEQGKQQLYNESMWSAVSEVTSASLLAATCSRAGAENWLDRTLYTDVHNYLPGALLVKVDRMTMAHSIEARSPFLDHKVMETSARLPVRCKVRGMQGKRILRDTFADLLPAGLMTRSKMGFAVPLGGWFRNELYDVAMDLLAASDTRVNEYFRVPVLRELLDEHRAGRQDHGKRLWALLNLEMWLRRRQRPAAEDVCPDHVR